MTQVQRVGKPSRWDQPFGSQRLTAHDVERVLSVPAFRDIDPADFPDDLGLTDIIANDGRIVRCARGSIVVRKGDYGGSMFVILKGRVRGFKTTAGERTAVQREPPEKMSWFRAFSQLWRNASVPEHRPVASLEQPTGTAGAVVRLEPEPGVSVSVLRRGATTQIGSPGEDGDRSVNARRELSTYTARIDRIDEVAAKFPTFAMGRNEMFGELAALARSPRSDTIFADDDDTELLELRWQGVRDIRQWSDAFHGHIDTLYRERGLASRLRESALFDNVDDTTLSIIAQSALFETHGNFEWTHRYKRELSGERGSEQIIELEPLIAEQGHYLDGILLLHSGFARISETFDQGERTVGYLARDDAFGLAELIESLQGGGARKIRHSLRAIGYVDVIRIPTHVVEEHLLSVLSAAAKPATPGAPDRRVPPHADEDDLQQSLLDFLVDYRFINGTKAMAMNTDRCVNCDDCVRACATAHDGNPRFIRHGHVHQNLMIANACMHCVDPVCLIGCPTGAIHRNVATGNVVIDDGICVGCATCANACPYDNIRMVEVRDANGSFLTDPDGRQILRATKCDFCADQLGGPACQRACPHDALVRIDLRDTDTLTRWLQPQK